MIFHENRLLADDSNEIPYLIFFRNSGKMSQNLSSAAVVISASRVKLYVAVPEKYVIFITICDVYSFKLASPR